MGGTDFAGERVPAAAAFGFVNSKLLGMVRPISDHKIENCVNDSHLSFLVNHYCYT